MAEPRRPEDTVTLKGMRFHTRIGVLPHEAEIAQSVEVDLSVWVSRRREPSGKEQIVDYRELYDIVAEIMAQRHHLYLEVVGEQIAERALAHPAVTRVRVSVRKPHVALAGPLAYAEITVERTRGE